MWKIVEIISGEARGCEKAKDNTGETSSGKEQTRFAREKISDITDSRFQDQHFTWFPQYLSFKVLIYIDDSILARSKDHISADHIALLYALWLSESHLWQS